jgi:hypothetical protein
MLPGAIRGLLRACPPPLAAKVRALLQRDDDYAVPGKPACDWTDRAAREQLVDALVRDAYRAHNALRDQRLDPRVAEAAALLATVTGQDIEETADGRFAIFEGTAPDRVVATVDPQARHGHKTAAHGFDGYKAHVAVDPDSEAICAAEVSAATSGDAVVAPTLLGDLASGEGDQAAPPVVYGESAYRTLRLRPGLPVPCCRGSRSSTRRRRIPAGAPWGEDPMRVVYRRWAIRRRVADPGDDRI